MIIIMSTPVGGDNKRHREERALEQFPEANESDALIPSPFEYLTRPYQATLQHPTLCSNCKMMKYLLNHVMTPERTVFFEQLVAVLDKLKDEQAECHSDEMGTTLVWNEETGKVWLTVRKFPYLSVNATVKTTQLWQAYMDDCESNGFTHSFYFDEDEDVCEFRVNNVAEMMLAAREMQTLNWFRLNWLQQKTDRRLVLAMGQHPRLGAGNPIATLDDGIVQAIAKLL